VNYEVGAAIRVNSSGQAEMAFGPYRAVEQEDDSGKWNIYLNDTPGIRATVKGVAEMVSWVQWRQRSCELKKLARWNAGLGKEVLA
jgi:hypothetical protein